MQEEGREAAQNPVQELFAVGIEVQVGRMVTSTKLSNRKSSPIMDQHVRVTQLEQVRLYSWAHIEGTSGTGLLQRLVHDLNGEALVFLSSAIVASVGEASMVYPLQLFISMRRKGS